MSARPSQIPLVTPGEMLRTEFLEPHGVTVYRLAKDLDVPATRLHAILDGTRSITADTALRLERYFGLSDGWFLRLQSDYDLRKAKREHGAEIARKVKPIAA